MLTVGMDPTVVNLCFH